MTFCQQRNNKAYSFVNPICDMIDMVDIVENLAKICRYGGSCDRFYSVLEHSILVCNLVPEKYKLNALMHDAAEAYVGDMSHPLKQLLPEFQVYEDKCMAVIAEKYEFSKKTPAIVKEADSHACYLECLELFPDGITDNWHEEFKSSNMGILPLSGPKDIIPKFKQLFLEYKFMGV